MSSRDLNQHDSNNLRMKHFKCENDNLEQAPVISIPESLMNEEKSVLELIPDDSTNFLETEENLIELNHHDEEIGEEELMKVKQELCEVTGDEVTGFLLSMFDQYSTKLTTKSRSILKAILHII